MNQPDAQEGRVQRFRTTDDVDLAYTDDGDGTAVVFVAGFAAPATTWHLQREALRAAGYRVIAFDRRNHGASARPSHGQRLARHGADLHELLEHLGLERAHLVGGSMGASAIWAYLDLFGFGRCLSMVAVDQTPKMLNDDGWQSGFFGLTRETLGTLFADGIPQTGRGAAPSTTLAGLTRLVELLGAMPQMSDPADPTTLPLLQNHAEADWRDVIARTRCPMLLVAGEDSQYWPSTHATSLAAAHDDVDAVVVPATGHAVNFDAPDAFNAVLLDFLDRHGHASSRCTG